MRAGRAAGKIIDEMRHDMRRTCLPRELKILARQHVAIQTEAKFHSGFQWQSFVRRQPRDIDYFFKLSRRLEPIQYAVLP